MTQKPPSKTTLINLLWHLISTQQTVNIFLIGNQLVCFSVLMLVFIGQFQQVNKLLPYSIPFFLTFIIGIFSKRFPFNIEYAFFIICLVGVQLLLFLLKNSVDIATVSCSQNSPSTETNNYSQNDSLYYIFGIMQMTIVTQISNRITKIIFIIIFFESSIFIINSEYFDQISNIISQIFILSIVILIYIKEKKQNKFISSLTYQLQGCIDSYKQSSDVLIIKSTSKNSYDVIFQENSFAKYTKQNGVMNQEKQQANANQSCESILQKIQVSQVQIMKRENIGLGYQWQDISQIEQAALGKPSFNLDWLLKLLYKKQDLWEQQRDKQSFTVKEGGNKFNLSRKYQTSILNNFKNITMEKQFLICQFQFKNSNGNKSQNQKQSAQVYYGKIFQQRNMQTNDRYLTIIITNEEVVRQNEKNQKYEQNNLNQLKSVQINVSTIKDLLNIPLRQSVNEILAKIILLQNNSKKLTQQPSISYNTDRVIPLSNQESNFKTHSNSQKTIQSSNPQKIENNIGILYQNILYMQTILQYQHQFIASEFLQEDICIKIQKFSLSEFVEETKDIIITQFFSYLQNFNLHEDYKFVHSPQNSAKCQSRNQYSSKNHYQTNKQNQILYIYTDLSILRMLIIVLCEKIVKGNKSEKLQSISLNIKAEANNKISFQFKFSEEKKPITMHPFFVKSLEFLGSTAEFEQTLEKNHSGFCRLISNNNTDDFNSFIKQQNQSVVLEEAKVPQTNDNNINNIKNLNDEKIGSEDKINTIKFIISQDITKKTKNLDALFLNKLRQKGDIETQFIKQAIQPVDPDDDLPFPIVRRQSKYQNYKLEYLAESLNFDQYDSVFTGVTEPYESGETERNIYHQQVAQTLQNKPSIFQHKQKQSQQINESNSKLANINFEKQTSLNTNSKGINNTKTIFIINNYLQKKERIVDTIKKRHTFYSNIYEFQSLQECINMLKMEYLVLDILVLDANNFLHNSDNYFSQIYKHCLKFNKNCFQIYIFNNDQDEHSELANIFKPSHFSIVKYSEIDTFIDSFSK